MEAAESLAVLDSKVEGYEWLYKTSAIPSPL